MAHLTEADLQRWLAAIAELPRSQEAFMAWLEGPLKSFFPHRKLFMAYGEHLAGQIKTTHWLTRGHEPRYLAQLATTFELDMRGSMRWWFAHRQPFTIDPIAPPPFATVFELDEIASFDLHNVAAHGVLNCRSTAGTYFSFCDMPGPLSDWHLEALRLMVPVLNDLYLDYVAAEIDKPAQALDALSPQQKRIVRLVAEGQDDKSVAQALGISEKTVRNQLSEVYAYLGIAKRGQLLPLLR